MTDFFKGIIAGAGASAIIFGVILALLFINQRDKELMEYAETQNEIQLLREDYGNRDPYEFLDEVPGVRGAADSAAGEFRDRRDEVSGTPGKAGGLNGEPLKAVCFGTA